MQILDRPSITDRLFDHCSPATILRVKRTCKLAETAVKLYMSTAYDVDRHLRRFVRDPVGLRNLMRRTGAIISGSFALQVMDRTVYPEGDLDLYVFQRDYIEIGNWFLRHSGFPYSFQPFPFQSPDFERALFSKHESQPEYDIPSISGVANFTCMNDEDGSDRKVQIIVAKRAPIQCVLEFHSTVVMNVVTHAAAYSFYPKATFEESRSLICNTKVRNAHIAFAKYARRGFQMLATLGPGEMDSPSSSLYFCDRWANDDRSWVLPFDTQGILQHPLSFTTDSLSFDPMEMNGWKLEVDVDDGQQSIKFGVFVSALLHFGYVGPQDFVNYMVPFLIKQGSIEYQLREQLGQEHWSWYSSHF
ncbi:hypothetical protein BD410DRAFT_730928 [Rickenella mellea]|uniref:Uncharacterized protein n=1 Tax=Rickenella mellea TaxID=50990 RepID=A0A4Y7PNX3_9AGAM|nr:hypothetical protein BD410DRAFT_730928 [Rickenella mellea]